MSATHNKPQSKTKFIDFHALKQEIKIEDTMPLLGLKVSQFSDQMRGPCPICKTGGDRALVVTASKGVFYCFAAGEGGDVIALTSHIKGIGMKEAAAFLAESFSKGADTPSVSPAATVPSHSSPKKEKAGQKTGLNPLTYLQPDHPSVQALGFSSETAQRFGAGYAPKGIMRGRLAIPLHDANGMLLAYCGRAIGPESPTLIFPNGFDPAEIIFNAHNLHAGPIVLLSDPLQVLKAVEGGVENAVAFLTDSISPQQLEMLSSLMDQKGCDCLDIH